jgi:hypothetical protein
MPWIVESRVVIFVHADDQIVSIARYASNARRLSIEMDGPYFVCRAVDGRLFILFKPVASQNCFSLCYLNHLRLAEGIAFAHSRAQVRPFLADRVGVVDSVLTTRQSKKNRQTKKATSSYLHRLKFHQSRPAQPSRQQSFATVCNWPAAASSVKAHRNAGYPLRNLG